MDLHVLLERTVALDKSDYKDSKKFVSRLGYDISIQLHESRMAVSSYDMDIRAEDYTGFLHSESDVTDAINSGFNFFLPGVVSDVGTALETAHQSLIDLGDGNQVILIVMKQESQGASDLKRIADNLRNDGGMYT